MLIFAKDSKRCNVAASASAYCGVVVGWLCEMLTVKYEALSALHMGYLSNACTVKLNHQAGNKNDIVRAGRPQDMQRTEHHTKT